MSILRRLFHRNKIATFLVCSTLLADIGSIVKGDSEEWKQAKSIYDFTAEDIKGNKVNLSKYKGQVCIIVNVASQCGYTQGHYEGLNKLYEKYHDSEGLCILGFPSNQFGSQEPGPNDEIQKFAEARDVKFDMFAKIDVNGENAHPLFKYLQWKQSGLLFDFIKWNFTKFIVDKNGQPVHRYGPNVSPEDMEADLVALFKENTTFTKEL